MSINVIYLDSSSSSFAPWAQCPLVSTTYFTKRLHLFLSDANPHRVQIALLHQSTRSSAHLLLGLPFLFFPSIMPKTACFISRSVETTNAEKCISFYEVATLFWEAYEKTATTAKATSGFLCTGICNLTLMHLVKWNFLHPVLPINRWHQPQIQMTTDQSPQNVQKV